MSWLLDFWRKKKLERELDRELRFHFEAQVKANLAAGLSADEAKRRAALEFGGLEQIKEECRDQRGGKWLEDFLHDLRYALRQLRKAPAFTVAAVLAMALGIGVNGALFIAFNAITLRPLPVHEPDELVRFRAPGYNDTRFSYPEYLDYRAAVQTFSGLAAWRASSTLVGPAPTDARARREVEPSFEVQPERAAIQLVSDNYFAVLGAEIPLGRGFSPEEYRDSNSAIIVLSHLYWTLTFRQDPNVLGKELLVSGRPHTIIGVTAPEFVGHQPAPPVGWIPLTAAYQPEVLNSRKNEVFAVIGRLSPGRTLQDAVAEVRHLAQLQLRVHPAEKPKDVAGFERGMKVFQIPWDRLQGKGVSGLAALLLGFAMVLAIACTNVANLLLARGVTRQQEIGVRLALGASRGRVLRQLLTENVLLCTIAAICGLVLARWSLAILVSRIPPEWGEHPGDIRQVQFLQFGLDWRIATFGLAIAVVTGLAAGLMPALYATSGNVIGALKDDGTAFGRHLRQSRLRNTLIVVQVAACMTMLSCAGQLLRNLIAVRDDDPGFDARNVYLANFRLNSTPPAQAPGPSEERQALRIVESLPDISAAALAAGGGVGGWLGSVAVQTSAAATDTLQTLRYGLVSSGYFATFGIRFAQGRGFTAEEVESSAPVVIVTETAAKRLWPGQQPIGKNLSVNVAAFAGSNRPSPSYRGLSVIGVVPDVSAGPRDVESSSLYLPLPPALSSRVRGYIRLRHRLTLAESEALQRTADAMGANLGVGVSMEYRLAFALAPFRYLAWLSGILGSIALLTAIIGLYGVMAFTVNQRVREIGIRIALGATAARVIRLFVRQGMHLVAIGVGVGLVGGGLFAVTAGKVTFGLRNALDPIAFIAVTALLAIAGALACYLPSRRATKVDPMVALRCE
jgi:predicted permease